MSNNKDKPLVVDGETIDRVLMGKKGTARVTHSTVGVFVMGDVKNDKAPREDKRRRS